MYDSSAWTRLALQNTRMLFASGRVINERVARAAVSNPQSLSARDQREFQGMISEKFLAVGESAMAGGAKLAQLYGELALLSLQQLSHAGSWWLPSTAGSAPGMAAMNKTARALLSATTAAWPGVIAASMKPVARRAHANDRRLGRQSRNGRR